MVLPSISFLKQSFQAPFNSFNGAHASLDGVSFNIFPEKCVQAPSKAPPGIVKGFFELHLLIIQEALAALRHDQRGHVLPASGSGDLGSLAKLGEVN